MPVQINSNRPTNLLACLTVEQHIGGMLSVQDFKVFGPVKDSLSRLSCSWQRQGIVPSYSCEKGVLDLGDMAYMPRWGYAQKRGRITRATISMGRIPNAFSRLSQMRSSGNSKDTVPIRCAHIA
jgi:hypothetical protein